MRNFLRIFGILIIASGMISLCFIISVNYYDGNRKSIIISPGSGEIYIKENFVKNYTHSVMVLNGDTIFAIEKFPRAPAKSLAWYMGEEMIRPASIGGDNYCNRSRDIWPSENKGDRIIEQLKFRPSLNVNDGQTGTIKYKKILLMSKFGSAKSFRDLKYCPVSTCIITYTHNESCSADAIIFDHDKRFMPKYMHGQVWIIYLLENPFNTHTLTHAHFNWTATYRHDSDIVTPYYRWEYYDPNIRQVNHSVDFAVGKSKQVAWFVSNCETPNKRLSYALELSKYISVDIYGPCQVHYNFKQCSRSESEKCFEMLRKDYKFYLSFENNNCRDYITEKFFLNALSYVVIPVAMGAHPDDYKRVAPEGSYIHVDDFESPKHLAEYLTLLDSNDYLYNQYFRWKGTGEFINTHFLCRVCALLHDECREKKSYENVKDWWQPEGICTERPWRESGWLL